MIVEFCMNRIQLIRSLKLHIFFLMFYFILTMIWEFFRGLPTQIDNLNWFCSSNISFLVNLQTYIVRHDFEPLTCDKIADISHAEGRDAQYFDFACKPLTTRYYCGE